MPSTTAAEKRIAELRKELDHHNHLYYVESRPSISDRDYDRLMHELIDLERANPDLITPDSPSQRVGGEVQTQLKPVRHAVPMMSIDNTYNEAEVRAFDERVRKALGDGEKPSYVLEPKIDGTSISLRYEEGKLVQAATRGRGNVGEDVTVNARTIKSIPLTLKGSPPKIIEVRGEVYMDNDDFQRVNKEIEAEGEEPYANPRNLTSGTLRRLDPKIVAKRRLRFLAHGNGQVEPMPADSYWHWTQMLRQWGFPLPKEVWHVKDVDEAIKCIHEFEKIRPKLPYMTDGMVMKVDAFAHRDRLGATSKAPRWVIAYKYETEQQPTVLKDVEWQVGKGGSLTPVGRLEPVFIGGVTVSNVTLHNIEQIRRLDLHQGDTIIIERAGEVIPYVLDVVKDKRPAHALKIEAPDVCPSCHHPVQQEKGSPQIQCRNSDCPGQLRERLIWFAGRSQMDIDGLGEKIVEQLIESRRLKTFADFFRLDVKDIAELSRETQLGEKKASAIVHSIQEARPSWSSFLHAKGASSQDLASLRTHIKWLADPKRLNLKGLGEKTIDQLTAQGLVRKPDDLLNLKVPQLAVLPQMVRVGETSARKIIASIEAAKSRGLSRVLASLGIRLVGNTVARTFAEWAGDINKLLVATVDELAAVLAKNLSSREASEAKEREHAKALFSALHDSSEGSLFETAPKARVRDQATEQFLIHRDKTLAHGVQLRKGRIQRLSECFPTVSELEASTFDALADCLLQGREVARSLHNYLHSHVGKDVIKELKAAGVSLNEEITKVEPSEWSGKSVVITGTFEGFSRDEIKKRLLARGARIADAVSGNTDIVLVGTDPGSKYDKAVTLKRNIRGQDAVERLMSG